MDSDKAYAILQLEKGASQEAIKKAYRLLALRYHPDKNGDPQMFLLVKDAYEYFQRQNQIPDPPDSGFSNILDALMQNERFKDIITQIVLKAEVQLFASISSVKRVAIYKILVLYKDYLHLSDEFLQGCAEILNKPTEPLKITEYYVLNPSLNDLFNQCVYKLPNEEYIPLWHRRVVINQMVVDCAFDLPEWVKIDIHNNVYFYVEQEISQIWETGLLSVYRFTVNGSNIRLVKNQCIQLLGQGIPRANPNDIYDNSVLSDIYIHLLLN